MTTRSGPVAKMFRALSWQPMPPALSPKPDAARRSARRAAGFLAAGGVAAAVWVGIETDRRTWTLLRNTVALSTAAAAVGLPVGSLLGWVLARTNLPGRRVGLALLAGMLFVPLYLQAAAWQAGFGLQGWATLSWELPLWLEGWTGAIWVHAAAAVPWVAILAAAGFLLVEPALEEPARLEAAPARVFWHVSLPAAWAALGVAAAWVFVTTAGEMTVTDLFQLRTFAEELYTRRAGAALGPWETLRGMSSPLFLLAWLVVLGLVLAGRLVPRERPAAVARRGVWDLGRVRWPAAGVVWGGLSVLVGVPLGNLALKAGIVVQQTAGGRVRWWSALRCLRTVVASPAVHAREFGWSLAIAGAAATTAVAAAAVLAWVASRGGLRGAVLLGLSAMLFVLPGTALALAVIGLLDRPELPALAWLYSHSLLSPWLAVSLRVLPPATLVLWYAFRTIPPAILDAAALDGAGSVRRWWSIGLPGRRVALLVAWLLAFALALGELPATILVVPPGVTPLSVRVFSLLHYGVEDRVAGIALAQILLFASLVALAVWISRRQGRHASPPRG